ncbi:MAG: Mut7-C RNAse domain-containing protein [Nitrososphaeraceae archaeon]
MKNVELTPPTNIRPVFFADAMLGSIARKLRVFGFDTIYVPDINDDAVLNIASKQNRIMLTCDKELFKRILKIGGYGSLLNGTDDTDNLVYIFVKYGINQVNLDTNRSRCAACNGFLEIKKIADIESNSIPARIRMDYKEIFRCTSCNKIYWKGSHFQQLRRMAKLIEARVKSSSLTGNSKCGSS